MDKPQEKWRSRTHFREQASSWEPKIIWVFWEKSSCLWNQKNHCCCAYKNPFLTFLSASSPLCYKQLGRGCGTSKHNCLVSYLLCLRRYVSTTVGHLQSTKIYIEENYTEYDHSIGAYSKLSTTSFCRFLPHIGPTTYTLQSSLMNNL